MSFEELEKLWNEFEDVPIDKDECIEEDLREKMREMIENTLRRY